MVTQNAPKGPCDLVTIYVNAMKFALCTNLYFTSSVLPGHASQYMHRQCAYRFSFLGWDIVTVNFCFALLQNIGP